MNQACAKTPGSKSLTTPRNTSRETGEDEAKGYDEGAVVQQNKLNKPPTNLGFRSMNNTPCDGMNR